MLAVVIEEKSYASASSFSSTFSGAMPSAIASDRRISNGAPLPTKPAIAWSAQRPPGQLASAAFTLLHKSCAESISVPSRSKTSSFNRSTGSARKT